jgi:hypothetical protein
VHADEVGADDVPVHVLERQMEVVVGAELLLQQLGDLAALLFGQAGDGELRHGVLLRGLRDCVDDVIRPKFYPVGAARNLTSA